MEKNKLNTGFESSISKLSSEFSLLKEEISEAKEKIEIILQSMDEGALFIDSNYIVQQECSETIGTIINFKDPSGNKFFKLLEKKIPENLIKNTQEFLQFMFQEDLDEETISELNPLQNVEFHSEDQWGLWTSSKHLSFRFRRIVKEGKISLIFCGVKDITEQIKLTKKLEVVEQNTKKQMEWLVNILHVKPPLLNEFVNLIEYELNQIDDALKNSMKEQGYKSLLNTLTKATQHIRSNASLLDLKFFSSKAQSFENEIAAIRNKKDISGSDFVPVVLQLGELRQTLDEIKSLMQRLNHFNNSLRTTRRYETGMLLKALESQIDILSTEFDRKIQFGHENFNSLSIPFAHQQLVKEFLIILTRFSVIYGIEKPEERIAANKNPVGTIDISTFSEKNLFGFVFRHDGRLIRIERLLQKAVDFEETEYSHEPKTDDGSQLGSEVIRLLFMPGAATSSLSEAEHSKEIFRDMDLVKKKLKMHGGKVKITFTSEQYCEYTITLPNKKQ